MRKKICNVLMLFSLMFVMTGCVKFNANMSIDKDKSMDFDIIYAVDTTYFGEDSLLEDTELDELEEQGFVVSDYSEGNMKGIKLSRNVRNIDLVSSSTDTEFSLSGLFSESESDNKYVFKVKKGLLKNVYKAKLQFDSSDSPLNDSMTDDDTFGSEEDYVYDDSTDFEDTSDDDSFSDFESMAAMSSLDLSFNVNLPYAAISNNATEVSNDGKNLKWNLSTSDEEFMEFEFELYNMTTIYIGITLIVVLLAVVIFLVIKKFGKKTKNDNPVNGQALNSQPVQSSVNDLNSMNLQNPQNNMGLQNEMSMNQSFVNQPINANNNLFNGSYQGNEIVQDMSSMNSNVQQMGNSNVSGTMSFQQVSNEQAVVPNVLDMKPQFDNSSFQEQNVVGMGYSQSVQTNNMGFAQNQTQNINIPANNGMVQSNTMVNNLNPTQVNSQNLQGTNLVMNQNNQNNQNVN